MSVLIMSRVFYTDFPVLIYKRRNGSTGKVNKVNSKMVMLVLADSANDEGKNSWQAVETIAGKSSLNWRTVTRTLISLRQNGYIWVDGKSEYDTNNYSINIDKLAEIPKVKRYPSTKKRYRKGNRGVTVTKLVCHGDSESIIYPSINIPAKKAGEQLCECKEDDMCEKCEELKKKIAVGIEYGFEYDTDKTKVQLQELEQSHVGEQAVKGSKSNAEKILDMMQGSENEYSDRLSDYPDRCRKPLEILLRKWNMSPMAVPKKSKSKGGLYATWISGIDDLVSISGEKRFEQVINKVYDVWNSRSDEYKHAIDMPQKLRNQFITSESQLKTEEIETMKLEIQRAKDKEKETADKFVDRDEAIKELMKFKKSMKSED